MTLKNSFRTPLSSPDKTVDRKRYDPYLVAVPITTVIFAMASLALQLGPLGVAGGAVIGLAWSTVLGLIAGKLSQRDSWKSYLANAPVFLAIIATGLLIGGGLMYGFLMNAALREPSTTYATLSALMQPTVPYYIVVNTLMEALIIPLVVFLNWHIPKRRALILIAVLAYFVMRVWTYITYGEMRLEISTHPLSTADVEWFKETMRNDYRGVLNIITQVAFILAAFVPARRVEALKDRAEDTRVLLNRA
jgi:hypothetical protein